jgi:hypothetical protein
MRLTDKELFDFDHDRLAAFDLSTAEETLRSKGDVFRAQLVAARWIEEWRGRTREDRFLERNEEWREGWDTALREVAAHLRQGDLVPGGVLHDETDSPPGT